MWSNRLQSTPEEVQEIERAKALHRVGLRNLSEGMGVLGSRLTEHRMVGLSGQRCVGIERMVLSCVNCGRWPDRHCEALAIARQK